MLDDERQRLNDWLTRMILPRAQLREAEIEAAGAEISADSLAECIPERGR